MPYRDKEGHFISKEEAEKQGITSFEEPDEGYEEGDAPQSREFGEAQRETESVFVDTGRGDSVEVAAGSPFVETLEALASRANYGGYYRIFLNGSEVVNPEDSPATIEPGMRIAITSYDKVGI